MKLVPFDQLKNEFDAIPQPEGRLGIFNVSINNRGKRYEFRSLKITYSNNPEYFGFSLNHYFWVVAKYREMRYKNSQFHDSEDVNVSIHVSNFKYAAMEDNRAVIVTNTCTITVTWP